LQAAKILVGGDGAGIEHGEEMLRARFQDHPVANVIKGFLPQRDFPARFVGARFGVQNFVEDGLPGARGCERIARHPIRLGNSRLIAGWSSASFLAFRIRAAMSLSLAETFLSFGEAAFDEVNAAGALK